MAGEGRPWNIRRPHHSDLDRLRDRKRILQLDAEVANGAVHLRVPEQELNGAEVAGLAVDLCDLGSGHRMGAIRARLQSDRGDPAPDEAGILPGRDVEPLVEPSGQRYCDPTSAGSSSHLERDFRVPSVISKRTGCRVLLWMIEARSFTWPAEKTSATLSLTRSHPRSLLSIARLKRARSRTRSASSRRTRIAQTCFGRSGRFWPAMRPLFQAGRHARMAGSPLRALLDRCCTAHD